MTERILTMSRAGREALARSGRTRSLSTGQAQAVGPSKWQIQSSGGSAHV
jgi:hypothetical protein